MSGSSNELFDHVAELAELYLRDEISAEQFAELETLVREDELATQAMRTVLKQAGTMRVVFAEQRQFTCRIGEVDHDEYLALLQTLSPTQEPELVHLVAQPKTHRPLWQQWQFVIPSAMAALLAIAVILIVMVPTGTPSTGTLDLAQLPDKPADSAPPIPRGSAVATLTAERNAQWGSTPAERALARGSELHADQTLTLTAGFAEITTARGAIAILEAPCIVELKDNDNALRLITGKLVGICETPSSKGFLVRTPHMDVIDLGTRFGVAIDETGQTLAQVFDGSVRVEPGQVVADGFDSQTLLSGKDITIDAQGEQTARDRFAADTFRSLQTFAQFPIELREGIASITGDLQWSSLATGEINDRNWSQSNTASIHQELIGHRLGADVAVSYHLPGVYTQHNEDTPSSTIPSGTVIRSYFIGLKAKGPGMQSSRASITFDGEILGIIAHGNTGQSFFDATHNKPDPVIPLVGNSLESGRYDPENVSNNDMIEIGQDRRTLTFAIQGVAHIDYFRVIVRDHVDLEVDQN